MSDANFGAKSVNFNQFNGKIGILNNLSKFADFAVSVVKLQLSNLLTF